MLLRGAAKPTKHRVDEHDESDSTTPRYWQLAEAMVVDAVV